MNMTINVLANFLGEGNHLTPVDPTGAKGGTGMRGGEEPVEILGSAPGLLRAWVAVAAQDHPGTPPEREIILYKVSERET